MVRVVDGKVARQRGNPGSVLGFEGNEKDAITTFSTFYST